MPEFKARQEEQQLRKEAELKPYIEAAMQRKEFMKMPADQDLPVFPALGRSVVAGDADPNKAAG